MLKSFYFMNKKTGELVTYKQANKEFYKVKRSYLESIFDDYIETDILSDENIELPDFTNIFKSA